MSAYHKEATSQVHDYGRRCQCAVAAHASYPSQSQVANPYSAARAPDVYGSALEEHTSCQGISILHGIVLFIGS